jgi:polyisoprenoid-binding protein YceI
MSTLQQEQSVPTGTWNADPVHSMIGFAVEYMAGTFQGTFSDFEARVDDGTLTGSAQVGSVHVKDPSLVAHLQSPDFFDAERTPELRFDSRELERSGDEVTIHGEITIKGHTEPIELRGRISDPIADPFGGERFGLELRGAVDRTRFGLSWNNPLPSGEPALADEVTIVADLQFVKA